MTYYAQNGEDKFLEEVFKDTPYGHFVDVGAWDGKYLSNTFLFVEKGWDGLEVEQDSNRVNKMSTNLPERIHRICKRIGQDQLDSLIAQYPDIPEDFDLLSIDIDSFDYFVWKNLTKYRPKVVVIESNSRPGEFVSVRYGSSPDSIRALAKEKGYTEIFFNGNLIFKRNDLL